MKTLMRCLIILGLILVVSCRDTKKEDAEAEAMVEEVEAVETQIEEIEGQIEEDTKALENILDELEEN